MAHEDLAVGALEPLDELGKERDELNLLAPYSLVRRTVAVAAGMI